MRYLILVITLLFTVSVQSHAQHLSDSLQVDTATGLVKYEGIADATGTKADLFLKAKTWAADGIKKFAIRFTSEDKEAGLLIGSGTFEHLYTEQVVYNDNEIKPEQHTNETSFTIKLFLKDGRYKYVINNITFKSSYMNTEQRYPYSYVKSLDSVYDRKAGKMAFDETQHQKYSNSNNTFMQLLLSLRQAMQKKSDTDF